MGLKRGLLRMLLFISAGVLILAGVVILIIDVIVLRDLRYIKDLADLKVVYIPTVALLAIGLVILITAILGIYAVMKDSYIKLITFAVCFSIVFIVEVAVGVAVVVFQDDLENILKKRLQMSMAKYDEDKSKFKAWNDMQINHNCCGVNGKKDWKASRKNIPLSCCRIKNILPSSTKPRWTFARLLYRAPEICFTGYNEDGCYDKIREIIFSKWKSITIVGAVVACLQIHAIIFACLLLTCSKRQESDYTDTDTDDSYDRDSDTFLVTILEEPV